MYCTLYNNQSHDINDFLIIDHLDEKIHHIIPRKSSMPKEWRDQCIIRTMNLKDRLRLMILFSKIMVRMKIVNPKKCFHMAKIANIKKVYAFMKI